MELNNSTLLIKSTKTQSFGTGFCIHKDAKGSFILTCLHVVEECGEDTIEIEGKKAELIAKGSMQNIDLAVLYVENLINIEVFLLYLEKVDKNLLVEMNGFKSHKKGSLKLEKLEGYIKKTSEILHEKVRIKTYELSINRDDTITKGFSGSAVLLKGTTTVVAVATDRQKDGKKAYAIPITYLHDIWSDAPEFLEHTDKMSFRGVVKKSLFQRIKSNLNVFVSMAVLLLGLKNIFYDVTLLSALNKENLPKVEEFIEADFKRNVPMIKNEISVALKKLNYKKANYLLDDYIEKNQDKNLQDAHHLRALIYIHRKQYHRAKDEFESFIPPAVKNSAMLLDYGLIYHLNEEYNEAIKFYKKALEVKRNNFEEDSLDSATIYDNLGSAYLKLGDEDKAYADYVKALKIYVQLSQNDLAFYEKRIAKLLINMLSIDPNNDQLYLKLAERFYNIGMHYKGANKYLLALESFKNAQLIYEKYKKEDAETLSELAYAYYKNEQYRDASRYYERALSVEFNNSAVFLNYYESILLSRSHINENLEQKFIAKFKDNKRYFIYYEVFKMLDALYHNEEYDFELWKKKYQNTQFNFNQLDKLINSRKEDKEIKEKLKIFIVKLKSKDTY